MEHLVSYINYRASAPVVVSLNLVLMNHAAAAAAAAAACKQCVAESAFYALRKKQQKKRKLVDRRASKSRKIRYSRLLYFGCSSPALVSTSIYVALFQV